MNQAVSAEFFRIATADAELIFSASLVRPNAAPEWQAESLRTRNRDQVAACPLEGLVMRVLPQWHEDPPQTE
jgi:hypothetical protein